MKILSSIALLFIVLKFVGWTEQLWIRNKANPVYDLCKYIGKSSIKWWLYHWSQWLVKYDQMIMTIANPVIRIAHRSWFNLSSYQSYDLLNLFRCKSWARWTLKLLRSKINFLFNKFCGEVLLTRSLWSTYINLSVWEMGE